MMNADYAIWREAVADILADSIISEYATVTLAFVNDVVKKYYRAISRDNPGSKKAMSLIIVYIMISREVASTTDWSVAEKANRKTITIGDSLLVAILKQVFDQLHQEPFWRITPEFVMGLGETYLSLLAHKIFSGFLVP